MRIGIKALITEASTLLSDLSYGLHSTLVIPDHIADDWTNNTRGYSFINNASFVPDRNIVLKAILQDSDLHIASVNNNNLDFNHVKIWDYLNKTDRLNEIFAIIVFIASGVGSRFTEFADHKYANGTRPRTIFIDLHDLYFVTRRVKTETQLRKPTFLPTKCAPIIAQLIIAYLVLIRPVESALIYQVKDEAAFHVYSEYMWVRSGSSTTPEQLRSSFKAFMVLHCNSPIGPHHYRQISVEIVRVFLGSEYEMKMDELDVIAAQAGHSVTVAQTHYAIEHHRLPSMPSELLHRFGRVSEEWWKVMDVHPILPALAPWRTRISLQPNTHQDTGAPIVMQSTNIDNSTALLTAFTNLLHSTEARLVEKLNKGLAELSAHLLLNLPQANQYSSTSSIEDADDIYASTNPPSNHSDTSSIESVSSHYNPSDDTRTTLLDLLQKHFPRISHPQFQSIYQMEMADVVLLGKENALIVIPTGGGKSLAFTLPPYHEPHLVSYWIIPHKSLLDDHIQKAEKQGIRVQKWTSAKSHIKHDTQLVFLALESAVSQTFYQ